LSYFGNFDGGVPKQLPHLDSPSRRGGSTSAGWRRATSANLRL